MKQRVQLLTVAVAAALLVVTSGAFGRSSAFSPVLAAQTTAKIDITGAWIFTVDTGTIGTPTVTFKQDGEKLTGHYSSTTLGEDDFTGTLKGQDLTFSFSADLQGTSVPVTYKGTVSSNDAVKANDTMKGTLDVAGGAATGTFTAKRK